MKSILIFGCNGFVGYYLAKEFKNQKYRVIASDQAMCSDKLLAYIDRYYEADILDESNVNNIIYKEKPDYLVNLAAISSVGASWKIPRLTMDVNVSGSINILEAVKKYSASTKVLLVGSSEEYEVSQNKIAEDYPINANNPYGISKVTQEHLSRIYREEFKLDIVNTRTFNHTGPGQNTKFAIPSFVKQVADIHNSAMSGIMKVGNLSAIRDLGDVRDMARAYRVILEGSSKETVFNVGSGQCYRLEDIVNYIVSLSGQKIDVVVDPEKIRPLDNPIIWCDNTRMKREFGWMPQFTIYDAINEMFKEMVVD